MRKIYSLQHESIYSYLYILVMYALTFFDIMKI